MKILFVNPRYGGVDGLVILPLDQASAVSYAVSNGLDVSVADMAFEADDSKLVAAVSAERFDLCVMTCITIGYKNAIETATRLKAVVPQSPIALMGEHASFRKEETLTRHPCFDYIISFEAEQTVVELARALRDGASLREINGLSYSHEGVINCNPDRKPVRTLDIFPIPAKHLYNIRRYLDRDSETTMVTARGCTHFCSFCHRVRYGRTLRAWSIDRVIAEIRYNLALGFTSIFFQDDVFCFDKKRTAEICERIVKERIVFRWNCNVRIDEFRADNPTDMALIALMKQAGCYRIFAGVESFSQELLDLNKKRSKIAEVKSFVRMFQQHDIEVHASYIIGFTGDTAELALATVEMASELGTEMASFNRIFPHPGTPLGDSPESVGIVVPDRLWYEKDYWKTQAVAGNVAMAPAQVYELQQRALERYTERSFTNLSSERTEAKAHAYPA